MIPALVAGAALIRGATVAAVLQPLIKPAVKAAFGLIKKTVRPGAGIGSKVTKGPLKLGKQKLLPGPARPGVGKVAGAVAGAAAVGLSTVASHRQAPKTQPAPRRASASSTSTSTERKCCPLGTKRMVCFKRGRVKKRKKKAAKKRRTTTRATKRRRTRKKKG